MHNALRNNLASIRWLALPLVAVALACTANAASPPSTAKHPSQRSTGVLTLEWEDLLPADEKQRGAAAAPSAHDYLSEEGPLAAQSGSAVTNPALDAAQVKIPGFVVPLSITAQGVISEFFLVPYYGACIHVPPPPPNQIVYVKMAKGFRPRTLYEPVWITGTLQARTRAEPMGTAAYTLSGEKIEAYDY